MTKKTKKAPNAILGQPRKPERQPSGIPWNPSTTEGRIMIGLEQGVGMGKPDSINIKEAFDFFMRVNL